MRNSAILSALASVLSCTGCGDEQPNGNGPEQQSPPSISSGASAEATAPGATKEVDGTITATVDGESKTWYMLSRDMGGEVTSQSEWSDYGASGKLVTLFGHASPNTMSSAQAIMLEFSLGMSSEDAMATSPAITYLVNESLTDLYNSDSPGEASIEIADFGMEGGILKVSGTFSGTVVPNMDGGEPAEMKVENGTFKAQIREFKDIR